MENKNKTILVTASAKRLGKFIAIDLIKKGWKVAIHYNKSKIMAEDTADYLSKIGGHVSVHQADLTCNSDIEKLVKEIEAQNSKWVGLINNAGYFNYDNGTSFRVEELHNHMLVNFIAPTLLTKALAKYIKMKKQKNTSQGFVINILDAKILDWIRLLYIHIVKTSNVWSYKNVSAHLCLLFKSKWYSAWNNFVSTWTRSKAFEKSHKKLAKVIFYCSRNFRCNSTHYKY